MPAIIRHGTMQKAPGNVLLPDALSVIVASSLFYNHLLYTSV